VNSFFPNSPEFLNHDTTLSENIFQCLTKKANCKLRFDEFMQLALYHPQHGYYSSSLGKKIGRKGDFFTSVTVGDTFGLLLSHAIEEKWKILCPKNDHPLVIVEQGAHDGQLARDILAGFGSRKSSLLENLEYRIVEPRESIRLELSKMADHTGYSRRLYPVQSLIEARAEIGIFLCNELLDAFPVRRFTYQNGSWLDQCVLASPDGNSLTLGTMEIAEQDEDFARFEKLTGPDRVFKDGYTTEFCPSLKPWIQECSQVFEKSGFWWVIDYGLTADQYFAETRHTGTLQCYHQHRVHEDPLSFPGENDLTAHVNFTDLIIEAQNAGLEYGGLTDQSRFLTQAGKTWLLSLDGHIPGKKEAARLRQFQTLTHPAMMGRTFQVAEFRKVI
jgi:SAM-dependent MidA family methyltransferase